MRKIILFTLLNCICLGLFSQENVCVLVDISRSIKPREILYAKQFLKDILSGNQVNTTLFIVNGTLPDMKMKPGDKLMIMPFGDRTSVMNYSPLINKVNIVPNDVFNFIDQFFPVNVTDNKTYLMLAKARLAEIAVKNRISNYSLIFISDNTSDDFGGRSNYTPYEKLLVDSYNTSKNPVSEKPGTRINLISDMNYSIFIQKVDVSSYTPPPGGIVVTDTLPKTLKIELTSLKGGTTKNPYKIKENKFSISWSCKDAPQNALYKVTIKPEGDKPQTVKVSGNSFSFTNVKGSQCRITVSPDNFAATSANTVVDISTGNLTWLLWVFLIALLLGGGYWFWNKSRQDKMRKTPLVSDDGFSQGSSLSKSSDNTGYF